MTEQIIILGSVIVGVFIALIIPYQIKINDNTILITKKKEWFGQLDTRYLIDGGIATTIAWLSDFLLQYSALPEPQAYFLAFASGFMGFDIVKWSHKTFDRYK